MSARHHLGSELLIGLIVLGVGCGGTLHTGTARKPINNKPAPDGSCPSEDSACGVGIFAVCVDLQKDPHDCGACDHACSPGIDCQAGVCQQTTCTGATIPFSGQTATAVSANISNAPEQIVVDVNGDGHLDLVAWDAASRGAANPDPTVFHVSLGQPGGGFATPDAYHASLAVISVLPADVNADGFDDLYVMASANNDGPYSPFRMELWLGHGDGQLTRSEAAGLSAVMITRFASDMALYDLSGDGWPDLVLMAPETDSAGLNELDVYLSDSVGALHLSRTYPSGPVMKTFVKDWDGDGSPDLVVLTGFSSLLLFHNRGDGTFEQSIDCGVSLPVGGGDDVLMEDFNRDGQMDLALGNATKRVGVILGLGGCGFTPITYYDLPGSSTPRLRAMDVNGDGQLDLISITEDKIPDPADPNHFSTVVQDNLLAVLLGSPDGTFRLQDMVFSLGSAAITDVSVGEVSGDQRPDIIVTGADGKTRTWENTCQ